MHTRLSQAVLLNEEIIAIDQDPLGQMGLRVSPKAATEVWARNLSNGDVAVAMLNKGGAGPTPPGIDNCEWKQYTGGYDTIRQAFCSLEDTDGEPWIPLLVSAAPH